MASPSRALTAQGGALQTSAPVDRARPSDSLTRLAAVGAYEAAGVSIAKGESVVERIRAAVESTGTTGFGAFAGLYPLDEQRLLAASTDSVGTKLILARERGQLRACGADLAAHCINDVITTAAEPLFLLDYVAANAIDPEQVAELVEGAQRSAGPRAACCWAARPPSCPASTATTSSTSPEPASASSSASG